ncbi:hypothetical protein P4O66_000541 [Electrophorus voltai]|uniref:DUF6729 domain-containing protein n=1 Tax=Electrophorus voltai TaxID=2609070 RepID=A0AAD8ZES2_9TELE|nr:hypothetical protein P4O66_000541 [Electrophorus voltai]
MISNMVVFSSETIVIQQRERFDYQSHSADLGSFCKSGDHEGHFGMIRMNFKPTFRWETSGELTLQPLPKPVALANIYKWWLALCRTWSAKRLHSVDMAAEGQAWQQDGGTATVHPALRREGERPVADSLCNRSDCLPISPLTQYLIIQCSLLMAEPEKQPSQTQPVLIAEMSSTTPPLVLLSWVQENTNPIFIMHVLFKVLLPEGSRKQHQWLSQVLFTREQSVRLALTKSLSMVVAFRTPAGLRATWPFKLLCSPNCSGHKLMVCGLYKTIRRVLDFSSWYFVATKYLECRRCKKKVVGWLQDVLDHLHPVDKEKFPAVMIYRHLCVGHRQQWLALASEYLSVLKRWLAPGTDHSTITHQLQLMVEDIRYKCMCPALQGVPA